MTEGLGYPRFAAHGSDLGAGVTASRWPATFRRPSPGIHLATPGLAVPPRPGRPGQEWSPAEEKFAAEVTAWTAGEGGYAHEHSTKPSTLGAALHDSPAGLAAWIGEKVSAWSAVRRDGQPAFGRDLLLSTLTLYWVTGTITSSLLPYWATRTTRGPRCRPAIRRACPPRSASSAASGSRFPSHPVNWPSGTSPLPAGLSTTGAGTSPRWPSPGCWRRRCAMCSGQREAPDEPAEPFHAPARRPGHHPSLIPLDAVSAARAVLSLGKCDAEITTGRAGRDDPRTAGRLRPGRGESPHPGLWPHRSLDGQCAVSCCIIPAASMTPQCSTSAPLSTRK